MLVPRAVVGPRTLDYLSVRGFCLQEGGNVNFVPLKALNHNPKQDASLETRNNTLSREDFMVNTFASIPN